jgi:hypothetical protein
MNTDHTDKNGIINKMKNLCLSVQICVLKTFKSISSISAIFAISAVNYYNQLKNRQNSINIHSSIFNSQLLSLVIIFATCCFDGESTSNGETPLRSASIRELS